MVLRLRRQCSFTYAYQHRTSSHETQQHLKLVLQPPSVFSFSQIGRKMLKMWAKFHLRSNVKCGCHCTDFLESHYCITWRQPYRVARGSVEKCEQFGQKDSTTDFHETEACSPTFCISSYIQLHEHPTHGSAADTTSQTDGCTWPPHKTLDFTS